MSKEKKEKKVKKVKKNVKKVKKEKTVNLLEKLRNQANKKNENDCDEVLKELNQASIKGEYVSIVKLKVNQVHYMEKLGLPITKEEDRSGYYEISWK